MKIFSIDFNKLALLLLPTFMRKPVLLSILQCAINPLRILYDKYTIPNGTRENNLYRLAHNGQVCYLRKLLNDAFNRNRENGFEIEDMELLGDWLITYDESSYRSSLIPIVRDNSYLKVSDENIINVTGGNFYVLYPGELTDDEKIRMRALVNQYKLVSRTPIYKIKT